MEWRTVPPTPTTGLQVVTQERAGDGITELDQSPGGPSRRTHGTAYWEPASTGEIVHVKLKLLLALLAVCALAVILLILASGPVLLEVGSEISILNPFRSRTPERTADTFLGAAANGACAPEASEALCSFIKKHPLPAAEWRLVNRRDSTKEIRLFYRLEGKQVRPNKNDRCLIAEVRLQQSGETWEISGYGVQPGPCNAKLSR